MEMLSTGMGGLFLFGAISLCAAALAVLLTGRMLPDPGRVDGARRGPVLLDIPHFYEFREGYLLSPIDPNDAFLEPEIDRSRAFETLTHGLAGLHADVTARIDALKSRGEAFLLTAKIGVDELTLAGRKEADRLVLTIGPTDTSRGREAVDSAALGALRGEAEDLRGALDLGPMLVWKTGRDDQILWANAPYFDLVARIAGPAAAETWPLPHLFNLFQGNLPTPGDERRCCADDPQGPDPAWYDVTARAQSDGGVLWVALPVGQLVAAETALSSFVQTLSKTFAHLPIGLAVFDRARNLMVFNPALVTHSTLDPLFLSSRPSLAAFLDALRDRQRMPEPKDYRSWRDEIERLEQGAQDGSYQELWSLPGGQTYRVMGRPHPDGAVAFMFEDISSEVSLTRQFRGDLALFQAVIDQNPNALAVFANDGRLVSSNAEYAALWGYDPAPTPETQHGLTDAIQVWQSQAQPTGLWTRLRRFAGRPGSRKAWQAQLVLKHGQPLTCAVSSLPGGASLVEFKPEAAQAPAAQFASLRRAAGAPVPQLD